MGNKVLIYKFILLILTLICNCCSTLGLFRRVWPMTLSACKYPGIFHAYTVGDDAGESKLLFKQILFCIFLIFLLPLVPRYFARNTFIYLDYAKYHIIYACSDNLACGTNNAAIIIGSRTRTIDRDDVPTLVEAIRNSGAHKHISESSYFPKQKDCPKELDLALEKLTALYQ